MAFDLTDEQTLHHTEKWMSEACATADDPVKFLVGTKKDLLVSCSTCSDTVLTVMFILVFNCILYKTRLVG